MKYSKRFKESVLKKVLPPENRSVQEIQAVAVTTGQIRGVNKYSKIPGVAVSADHFV